MSAKNNQINVPQAKQAMEQFKMQAASEVGVNLQSGYNASLTSREDCELGNQLVKRCVPYELRNMRVKAELPLDICKKFNT